MAAVAESRFWCSYAFQNSAETLAMLSATLTLQNAKLAMAAYQFWGNSWSDIKKYIHLQAEKYTL